MLFFIESFKENKIIFSSVEQKDFFDDYDIFLFGDYKSESIHHIVLGKETKSFDLLQYIKASLDRKKKVLLSNNIEEITLKDLKYAQSKHFFKNDSFAYIALSMRNKFKNITPELKNKKIESYESIISITETICLNT